MPYKPYKFGKALGYAFLIWIIGFLWGMIVFMVPLLKNLPSVAYISKFPAISVPLMIFYFILLFYLTKTYLKETDRKAQEGLKFGVTIFLVNIVLDTYGLFHLV